MPSSYVIGEHFERFVAQLIESGRYNSASEVIRDGLRLLEDAEVEREAEIAEVKAILAKRMNDEPGIPAQQVFDELMQRYVKMTEQQQSRK